MLAMAFRLPFYMARTRISGEKTLPHICFFSGNNVTLHFVTRPEGTRRGVVSAQHHNFLTAKALPTALQKLTFYAAKDGKRGGERPCSARQKVSFGK